MILSGNQIDITWGQASINSTLVPDEAVVFQPLALDLKGIYKVHGITIEYPRHSDFLWVEDVSTGCQSFVPYPYSGFLELKNCTQLFLQNLDLKFIWRNSSDLQYQNNEVMFHVKTEQSKLRIIYMFPLATLCHVNSVP